MAGPPPFAQTFSASIRSVASAFTLAAVGIYLHRRGFVEKSSTKILAKISKQVTLPLLFFTSVVQCNQNMSNAPCPNVTASLPMLWGLLFWPAYVVGWGLAVGYAMAIVSGTPRSQVRSVLAACAFANSTGMPITLFAVLRINFPNVASIGEVNPMLFLSIYLLTYPILQWGVGGWLLEKKDGQSKSLQAQYDSIGDKLEAATLRKSDARLTVTECSSLLSIAASQMEASDWSIPDEDSLDDVGSGWIEKICECTKGVVAQVRQPPVLGAVFGFLVVATPVLRALFVDTYDRNSNAPLQWFFDSLFTVGQAAVPINMIILGVNLSHSQDTLSSRSKDDKDNDDGPRLFSRATMLSIVIGKMVVMPIIGFVSVVFLDRLFWHASGTPHAPMCLVAMVVFITPTANNVMVMVELSGGNKEGMARAIAWQYAAAPLLLSLSVSCMVGSAMHWA